MINENYSAVIKENWYTNGVYVKIEAKNLDELRLIRKNVLEAIDDLERLRKNE